MTGVRLTAVVVTYRSEQTLPAAIESARRCHDAGVMETVFVDNASPDRTRDLLEPVKTWATVVSNNGNVGFGRGCNRGLAEVRTPLTIFLNPDATLEPEAAMRLVRFMDATPRAGICGPAIIEQNGSLQFAGTRPTPLGLLARYWRGGLDRGLFRIEPGSSPVRCGWICGAAFVIRTELARELGGFDPRFFMYFEESDLSKRAEDKGWEIWTVGEAVAHHLAGASSEDDATRISGCIARFYYQSRFYYFRKHHGWLAATATDIAELIMLLVGCAKDVVRGRGIGRLRPRLQTALFRSPEQVAAG